MAWIEMAQENCDLCGEQKTDTLVVDWSGGEYTPGYICQDCLIKTFKESGFIVLISKEVGL